MNTLYRVLVDALGDKTGVDMTSDFEFGHGASEKTHIIPPERVRYLAEIADASDQYDEFVDRQASLASQLYRLYGAIEQLRAGDSRLELARSAGRGFSH